jgi:hypothetical protein
MQRLLAAVAAAAAVLVPISAVAQQPTLSASIDPSFVSVTAGEAIQFDSQITNISALSQMVCADSLGLESPQYFTSQDQLSAQMPIPIDAGNSMNVSAFILTALPGTPVGEYQGYWAVADLANTLSDYSTFTVRVVPTAPSPEFGSSAALVGGCSLLALNQVRGLRRRRLPRRR